MNVNFLGKSKITSQGQLTLPLEGRAQIGVSNGAEVFWYSVNDFLIVTKKLCSQDDITKILKKSARCR
ncbi:MAG TPA: AbrB/MazE/SpoVT family DNA-binding domain-containing protein [Candidatus Nanoarchaeia archaeon]|nr:AbrB/MazE/SpoVT family DNA-binding domain-containing protein [Candidatus Nanoarchaeia archaeon]